MEAFSLTEFMNIAATPVGLLLVYYLSKLSNKINLLENEIKHLRELIYNVGKFENKD